MCPWFEGSVLHPWGGRFRVCPSSPGTTCDAGLPQLQAEGLPVVSVVLLMKKLLWAAISAHSLISPSSVCLGLPRCCCPQGSSTKDKACA